eukprot:4325499-Pyramimonas_sp.AAC.1
MRYGSPCGICACCPASCCCCTALDPAPRSCRTASDLSPPALASPPRITSNTSGSGRSSTTP